jgi:hypothetical protein
MFRSIGINLQVVGGSTEHLSGLSSYTDVGFNGVQPNKMTHTVQIPEQLGPIRHKFLLSFGLFLPVQHIYIFSSSPLFCFFLFLPFRNKTALDFVSYRILCD